MKGSLQVFKKEMRELVRDKRARSAAIIMPMVSVLITLFFFGFVTDVVAKPEAQRVDVVRTNNMLVTALKQANVDVREVPDVETGRKLVRDGEARLVLQFDPDFDAKLNHGEGVALTAIYNPDQESSQIALHLVTSILANVNKEVVSKLLASHGMSESLAEPISVKQAPERVFKGQGAGLLTMVVPYLLVLLAFFGAMTIASDLVAGEKEKGTLETLLVSPVDRQDIAFGKFYALCAVSMLSAFSSLLGIGIGAVLPIPMLHTVFDKGVDVSPASIAMILLVLLPMVALVAAIMLALSTYSRNVREAQTYIGQASIFVTIPAAFSQLLGISGLESAMWIRFVPILNTSATMRNALLGKYDWVSALVTAAISAVIAVLVIRMAVRMFNKESVLLRV